MTRHVKGASKHPDAEFLLLHICPAGVQLLGNLEEVCFTLKKARWIAFIIPVPQLR